MGSQQERGGVRRRDPQAGNWADGAVVRDDGAPPQGGVGSAQDAGGRAERTLAEDHWASPGHADETAGGKTWAVTQLIC